MNEGEEFIEESWCYKSALVKKRRSVGSKE
jgi:hypothetical protein